MVPTKGFIHVDLDPEAPGTAYPDVDTMGHAVTGVLGMAFARRGKAVAIAGDGAMLMNNEISTAVQYRLPAVWIVLNDSGYGMVEQGMKMVGIPPFETRIPTADFAAIAGAMGADGVRVEREEDVLPALERAMDADGPFVVDVIIDSTVTAPASQRSHSLDWTAVR
jgi:acetolactate synthase-1/2/3 large subunit